MNSHAIPPEPPSTVPTGALVALSVGGASSVAFFVGAVNRGGGG